SSYPSAVPLAPSRKWWSITLCPSSPELVPKPSGHISVAERISTAVELNADAHRNTTLALYSMVSLVSASKTSTPVAFLVSLSYNTRVAIDQGLRVRLPVATAAGRVEDWVLK